VWHPENCCVASVAAAAMLLVHCHEAGKSLLCVVHGCSIAIQREEAGTRSCLAWQCNVACILPEDVGAGANFSKKQSTCGLHPKIIKINGRRQNWHRYRHLLWHLEVHI